MPSRASNYTPAEMPPRLYGGAVTIVSDGRWNGLPGLAQLLDGTLIAVYSSDATSALTTATWRYQTSTDGGATWSSATTFHTATAPETCGHIEVVRRLDGNLLTAGNLQYGASDDVGVMVGTPGSPITWSAPVRISSLSGCTIFADDVYTASKPVRMANETWLLPVYGKVSGDSYYSAGVTFSADDGASWGNAVVVKRTDGVEQWTEAFAVLLSTGRIVMLIRHDEGTRGYARTISDDNGATWSNPSNVIVPSGVTDDHKINKPCIVLLRQDWLLFISRTPVGTQWCYSTDQGATWSALVAYTPAGNVNWANSMTTLADGNIGMITAFGNGAASDMLYQRIQQLQ